MKTKKEIQAQFIKIKSDKRIHEINPHFIFGYEKALEWVLDIND